MIKRVINRIRLNFRQTNSERAGQASYRSFGRYMKEKFNKYVNLDQKSKIKSQNYK